MGFKIIKAFSGGCETRIGKEYVGYEGGKLLYRTLDDDGNIAYHAYCDDEESAILFHDWSARDVGSVHSQYREDSKWKEFIG